LQKLYQLHARAYFQVAQEVDMISDAADNHISMHSRFRRIPARQAMHLGQYIIRQFRGMILCGENGVCTHDLR